MPTLTPTTSTAPTSLARIRDNQRRSRARRKEYLQELEAKYRTCEQLGVKATAEIQVAARRVAHENKRLRALLARTGVNELEIERWLAVEGEQRETINQDRTNAAQSLEGMVGARRKCGAGRCGSDKDNSTTVEEETRPPMMLPTDRALETVELTYGVSPYSTSHALDPAQTLASQPSSLQTTLPLHSSIAAPSPQYPTPVQITPNDFSLTHGLALQTNTSSCIFAADIITSMSAAAVSAEEVEEELGCSGGQECTVDNGTVWRVMDKYSEGMGVVGI
ncbi:MAG: hypothetical protein M1827_002219 [Pycnora praestabilis]|nr:MAG: hypothetical protein M1827_002219 [Pycnora praestabilis]